MFTIIAGTRPEIIKLAPVYFELKKRNVTVYWIHSGQHNADTYKFFEIKPDEILSLYRTTNSLSELTSQLLYKLDESVLFKTCDNVIVHGDTSTAFCAALASYYQKKNLFHVEAGLRTFQSEPFPEEKNREMIARVATIDFSPTEENKNNLIREGISESKIVVTGNTIVDATLFASSKFEVNKDGDKLVVVTAHRRENWGEGIQNICKALNLICETHKNVKVLFPVHPNPELKKTIKNSITNKKITLCEPLAYGQMLQAINNAWLVLTDSGGIQEECITLQKPVLVTRNTTERNEVIDLGAGKLVGTDITAICSSFNKLWNDRELYDSMKITIDKNPYGDGTASKKIVDVLLNAPPKIVTASLSRIESIVSPASQCPLYI